MDSLKREMVEAEQRLKRSKEQLETEEQESAQEAERRRQECRSLEEEVQEKVRVVWRDMLLVQIVQYVCGHAGSAV